MSVKDRKTELGQILPMASFLLIPLIILAAFAVDLGSFYHRGSQLQSASDLASLAGAELKSQGVAESEILDSIDAILEGNGIDTDAVDIDVSFSGEEVKVSLSDDDVAVYLSSFFMDSASISRSATAVRGTCVGECEQPVVISPPLNDLPTVSQGDGTVPLAVRTDDGKEYVFTLNHHQPSNGYASLRGKTLRPQLVCVDIDLHSFCPGYPKRVNTSTAEMTRLVWSEATNEVWFPIQRPTYAVSSGTKMEVRQGVSTYIGLGCIDLETLEGCGEHKYKTIVHGPPLGFSGNDIDHRAMVTQPQEKDNKFYTIDNNMKVHCFDPVTRSKCSGYPVQPSAWNSVKNNDRVGNPPQAGKTYDGFEASTLIIEDNIYAYWPTNSGFYATCLHLATATACPGFGTPLITNIVNYWAPSFFESMDSSGNLNGICGYGPHPLSCVTLEGNSLDRSDLEGILPPRNLDGRNYRFYAEPLRIGSKLFVPAMGLREDLSDPRSISRTFCIDLVVGESCGERPDPQPYGYSQIPGRNCIISLGHLGRFSAFSPDTLGACPVSDGLIEVFPCACGDGSFYWGQITFDPGFLENFDSFEVLVRDASGDTLIPSVDLIEAEGRLDLSDVDPTINSLFVVYTTKVKDLDVWTEPIDGKFSVTERATLVK